VQAHTIGRPEEVAFHEWRSSGVGGMCCHAERKEGRQREEPAKKGTSEPGTDRDALPPIAYRSINAPRQA